MDFEQFWCIATAGNPQHPFPFQIRLAREAWPDLLRVPTGLGKTAGVVLSWLYKQYQNDAETPRRLVYCLPMRSLVEQTERNTRRWLGNLRHSGIGSKWLPEKSHIMLGGSVDDDWLNYPENPAILIGTQDMLLSRALMRGYGVGRSRWPIDFALLHNDAMWVFDEVQLMAAGAPTSAQLEGLRRKIGTFGRCRSLWVSATLEQDWLNSVDLPARQLTVRRLDEADLAQAIVRRRLDAPKQLIKAQTELNANSLTNRGIDRYAAALAREVLAQPHRPGKTTLLVLNRVRRAQAVYSALKASGAPQPLLVHSRFRPQERAKLNEVLMAKPEPEDKGRIVIATQAVEAGVDLSSAVMFTELAPWASLVQRFGRLNRSGEETDAQAFWIDAAPDLSAKDLAPYAPDELDAARKRLLDLNEVSPATLEPIAVDLNASWQVLRRRDLYQLFDTDADLTGFDVDVSPYVRGSDDTDVSVFWRVLDDKQPDPNAPGVRQRPQRDELCAIPFLQAKTWLQSANNGRRAFVWDWLDRRWNALQVLSPGALVMVDARIGGYDEKLGFDPASTAPVNPVVVQEATPLGGAESEAGEARELESQDGDPDSQRGRKIALTDHLAHVRDEARALCRKLPFAAAYCETVVTAGLWHDLGKAHAAFKARCGLKPEEAPLAKTPDYRLLPVLELRSHHRRYFRHELASALGWLEHGPTNPHHDLIAYLIAAHHGKVRMGLRALPKERGPRDNPAIRFARGVWDGDRLPAVAFEGLEVPETVLTLDVMELGGGGSGRSWAARTQGLLEDPDYGPFRLAFLESLVRIADWRASASEQRDSSTGTERDD